MGDLGVSLGWGSSYFHLNAEKNINFDTIMFISFPSEIFLQREARKRSLVSAEATTGGCEESFD